MLLSNGYKHPIVHIQAMPLIALNNPGVVVFLSNRDAVQDPITLRAVMSPSKLIRFVTVFVFLDLGMVEGYGAVIFRLSVMGRPKLGPFGTGTHRGLILRPSLVFQTTNSQFSCVMWMFTICLILLLPRRHKPYRLRRQSHLGAVFPNTHLKGDPGNPHFLHAVFSKNPCSLLRLSRLIRRATQLCKALCLWLKL